MSENLLSDIERWLNELMPWMYWKGEVLIFLIGFFVFLALLAYISVRKPSNPKTGFLKIPLTRGDRIFVSAVLLVATMLTVLSLGMPWYIIFVIGIPIIIIIWLKG